VDEPATLKLARDIEADQVTARDDGVARLRVSAEERDRLLAELAKSKGKPAPPAPVRPPVVTAPAPAPPPTDPEPADTRAEERYWRERSRALEETVRQAHEDLEFLQKREQNLQDEILGLLSRGYRANQFSLQVFKLDRTRDAIEETKLDVARAERALQQFREDARREGILPGWLR
jgi:type IV secretory pathway VirB10-like protein